MLKELLVKNNMKDF